MDFNIWHIVYSNLIEQQFKKMNIKKINKEEFGKLVTPEKIYKLNFKEELEKLYEKLYFDNINYTLMTNFFFLAIIISFILYLFLYPYIYIYANSYIRENFLYKFVVLFITWFAINMFSYYSIIFGFFLYNDSKFKKDQTEIEKVLPEFIDNLVSNLKGGISLEKAMIKSVRKEQRALLKEVTLINEKIMMGKSTLEALTEFRNRYNSPVLNRTIFLMEEGIKGGGNLAAPLERISENLKRVFELEEEIKSNSGGFSVIITMITLVVAPLLFALALTLLTFIGNLFKIMSESNVDTFFSAAEIPPEFSQYLIYFSYAMIVLITFFSSLITSHLKNEKIYTALKYLPVYIILAIMLFNVFSDVLLGFFGNILG